MATFDFKFVNEDSTPAKQSLPAVFSTNQSLSDLSWQLAAVVDPSNPTSQKLKEFHRLCRNGFVKKAKVSVEAVLTTCRESVLKGAKFEQSAFFLPNCFQINLETKTVDTLLNCQVCVVACE